MPEQTSRRAFLKTLALSAAAAPFAATSSSVAQGARIDWKQRVGVQLNTVRDIMSRSQRAYEETLAALAEIGFAEIETSLGYNDMEPKTFRAMLDRYGLRMYSTHSGARGTQAEIERTLEGFQIMGLQYTDINDVGVGRVPPGQQRPPQPPSAESFKRRAAAINDNGKIAQRFGMKMMVHNLTAEFHPLPGTSATGFDILLAETDPAVSAMQLDMCWASIALQDIVGLLNQAPGRFELWHVKDVFGLRAASRVMSESERRQQVLQVPVGQGDIDYKTIFTHAETAGLRHFVIEQDNAAAWGDSLAAARVGFENLTTRILL